MFRSAQTPPSDRATIFARRHALASHRPLNWEDKSWNGVRENSPLRHALDRVAAGDRYPLHHRSEFDADADAHALFAHLDDHRRLAGHMEKPSLMMAGATLRVETDAQQGQVVGLVIRVAGRVLGMSLAAEEMVIERAPLRKTWETQGEPRLLIIGSYRVGFTISPEENRSRLVVFIERAEPLPGRQLRPGPADYRQLAGRDAG